MRKLMFLMFTIAIMALMSLQAPPATASPSGSAYSKATVAPAAGMPTLPSTTMSKESMMKVEMPQFIHPNCFSYTQESTIGPRKASVYDVVLGRKVIKPPGTTIVCDRRNSIKGGGIIYG